MASQREQFLSLAAKFEPKIQEALIRAFNSARVGVSEKKLVEALKSGGVGAVMDLLGNFRNLLDTEISTPLEGAIVAGGQLPIRLFPPVPLLTIWSGTILLQRELSTLSRIIN